MADPRERTGIEWLSLGPDNRPGLPRALLAAVAVGCLTLGVLVGATAQLPAGTKPSEPVRRPVSIGAIEVDPAPMERGGPRFMLPVFNAGEEDAAVSIVDLGGWVPRTVEPEPSVIPAGRWQALSFFPPTACGDLPRGPITEARISVGTSAGEEEWLLRLPQAAEDVGNYHHAVCDTTNTVATAELSGIWLVDQVFGTRTNLERSMLIKFNPDGTYSADAGGRLLASTALPWEGAFAVADGRLTLVNDTGWACQSPKSSTSALSLLDDGRLGLAFLEGTCPEEPSGVWLLRRLLDGEAQP
jgi:hypothetical protein